MSDSLNPDELAAQLSSDEPDQRERAARAIHSACAWDLVPPLAGALRDAVRTVPSAAAMLLLARDPNDETRQLLRQVMHAHTGKQTKLELDSPAVPLETAAAVALSAAGDSQARRELHRLASSDDPTIRRFLLEVIGDIDDPPTLQQMRQYLSDQRETPGGVPHGATPSRRIADLAADALIDRLNLAVSFARRPAGRYDPDQLAEVDSKVRASIPA
jgi:HEAT repeat protein